MTACMTRTAPSRRSAAFLAAPCAAPARPESIPGSAPVQSHAGTPTADARTGALMTACAEGMRSAATQAALGPAWLYPEAVGSSWAAGSSHHPWGQLVTASGSACREWWWCLQTVCGGV
ncbi:hypothetical protein CIB84_014848 [Bambusicola thoracicus]|uniref:Uncharacterized protein n=1 Tax=Bambusicola thoracicus TaxID=9083 RepID=A0A2P4SBB8_BAMTH|nr:hypothetical protein CIB84_014848 [Bambusicola thoracicus]